jgi:hypothetical protein
MLSLHRSKPACLACALGFLWATPALAPQDVPGGWDVQFFNAYRRSNPITKWPLKKTLHEIPELAGLEPASDQSRLPEVLRRVGENLQDFVTKFVDTTSLETIEETRKDKHQDTSEQIVQRFRYLMLAPQEGNAGTLIEYRTDLRGREGPSHNLIENFLKTTGFASMPLFFGPLQQPWSDFRYLGQQMIDGRRTEVVAFAEHIDPAGVKGRFVMGNTSVPVLLQGVAWIHASDYQILRMRTDLLAPQPGAALRRMTTAVLFAGVKFEGGRTALWLPQEVDVTVELGNYVLVNRHRYSDYRLFKVEILQPADEPGPPTAQHP